VLYSVTDQRPWNACGNACPRRGRVFSIRVARSALKNGPVAQLGARFHGMEEVDGSNPSRSTTTFQTLTVLQPAKHVITGVQLESKPKMMYGQPWAPCGFRCCPQLGFRVQRDRRNGQSGHHFSRLLSAGDDNKRFPYKEVAQCAPRWCRLGPVSMSPALRRVVDPVPIPTGALHAEDRSVAGADRIPRATLTRRWVDGPGDGSADVSGPIRRTGVWRRGAGHSGGSATSRSCAFPAGHFSEPTRDSFLIA
jgi:hypothetical protein